MRRNNKFQRFVAAKQNRRVEVLKNHSKVMVVGVSSTTNHRSTCSTSSDELGVGMHPTTVEIQRRLVLPKDPSGCYASRCISEESPTHNLAEDDTSLSSKIRVSQRNLPQSPTSVMGYDFDLTLLHADSGNGTKLPALLSDEEEEVAQKEKLVFNFIRVESNSNPKGIIKHNDKKSQMKKKLTWWDDDCNMHKPSLLKTDGIPMNSDDDDNDDDESTIWELDHEPPSIIPSCACYAVDVLMQSSRYTA